MLSHAILLGAEFKDTCRGLEDPEEPVFGDVVDALPGGVRCPMPTRGMVRVQECFGVGNNFDESHAQGHTGLLNHLEQVLGGEDVFAANQRNTGSALIHLVVGVALRQKADKHSVWE